MKYSAYQHTSHIFISIRFLISINYFTLMNLQFPFVKVSIFKFSSILDSHKYIPRVSKKDLNQFSNYSSLTYKQIKLPFAN